MLKGAYPMSERVVFSQLGRKFVVRNDAARKAQQVVYYSTAIGHHGVIGVWSRAHLPVG